jgi:alkanesulfonate monooxygenase SsuD/methylene tetrahydromethanopterin reductase-like flavin-dependent oxidoreductase (luciferase family)
VKFGAGVWGMQSTWRYPQRLTELYREAIEEAQLAEALGYDSVWVTEHRSWYDGYCPSLLLTCAALAGATNRIKVGTASFLLPQHDPLRVAEEVALVDEISNGRFVFAVAQGYRPEEFAAVEQDIRTRGKRSEEQIRLLMKAWTEDPFSFEGKYYKYENVSVRPRPVQQPYPELWLSSTAEPTTRRAARMGLPVYLSPAESAERVKTFYTPLYREVALAHGNAADKVYITKDINIGRTEEAARREAEEPLKKMYVEQLGGWRFVTDENGNAIEDVNHPVYERIWDSFIQGTPERCIDKVAEFADAGVQYMVCRFHAPGKTHSYVMDMIRLFADTVMPHFA